jgi:signal transduction histidine kinase
MLRLSRGVVAYSRPAEQSMVPVDIREVTNTAIALVLHSTTGTGINLVSNLSAPSHSVIGRQGSLTQVFVNLLSNAIHAMQQVDGNIEVRSSATADGQRLVVEVVDVGTGIATEDMGRIFDAFFTTKGRGQGTGLGLAIVRDIVEHHGGAIRATSSPGQGTTFTLVLPLARGRASADTVIG